MPGLLTRERRGELLTAACREIESLLMTQIFVGNVPDDASERVLRSIFERHGRVTSVRMANEDTHLKVTKLELAHFAGSNQNLVTNS